MTTLFVRHTVKNFDDWKKAYDNFRPTQQRLGVTSEAVYRESDDPNSVTVTHEFASTEQAQQFLASDDLRQTMDRAGVTSEPTVWFADRA